MRRGFRPLMRLLRGSGRPVAASLLIAMLQAALLIPIALLVRHAFDETIPGEDTGELVWLGAAMLGLYLTSTALALVTRWYSLRATKDAMIRIRSALIEKIFVLPRSYFDRTDLGRLHSTIVQDSERLELTTNALVAGVMPAATISVGLGVALLVLNPLLTLVLAITLPLLMLANQLIGRTLRERTNAWQRAFDTFSSETQVALRAVTLTKLHGAEEPEAQRRTEQVAELGEAGRAMYWMHSAYVLLHGIGSATAGVIVLIVGGAAVADGRMSIGDLIAFYAVLGLLRGQLSIAQGSMPIVISGAESLARLDDLLELRDADPYRGERRISFQGGVTLDRVSFGYGGEPVLEEVSLEVNPGEAVALLGPNAAGKSTVISLIAGLYEPQSGTVLADGVPLAELDLAELRRGLGVVVQDPLILPTSIGENIAYGRPEAGREEIESAARRADAHDFIAKLPDGYDTHVGDDGLVLSGGQRQRLAIARVLLSEPKLLVLDEPTTYLDEKGAHTLLRRLLDHSPRPSVLIVSHDPTVVSEVDRVYVLRDRRIQADVTGSDAETMGGRAG